MQQLLMKPGDPSTLYATAYGVIGLFRSTDAGEHWAFVSDKAWANNNDFAVDPLHPDWLYVFTPNGLMRSQDEGDTWTTLMANKWPDGSDLAAYPQVYVSPYRGRDPPAGSLCQLLRRVRRSARNRPPGADQVHRRRGDWTIVPSLEGVPVQDIAFDPNDHSHMVLVTSDMRVYNPAIGATPGPRSRPVASPRAVSGSGGSITYNPGGSEVWIDAPAQPVGGGIFKSAATDLTSWQDVSPSPGYGSVVPRVHQCRLGLHPSVPQHRRRHELGPVRPLALVWLRRVRLRPDRLPRRPTSQTTRSGCRRPPIGWIRPLAGQGPGIDRP